MVIICNVDTLLLSIALLTEIHRQRKSDSD
jgi:hypothetical protein